MFIIDYIADYFHNVSINGLVYKISDNSEKCWWPFP